MWLGKNCEKVKERHATQMDCIFPYMSTKISKHFETFKKNTGSLLFEIELKRSLLSLKDSNIKNE